MSNEEVCRYIIQYAADEKKLGPGRDRQIFFRRSHVVWTCKALYSEIKQHPDTPAKLTIEDFVLRVSTYSYVPQKVKSINQIFSIAYDTAQDILDGIDIYDRLDLGGSNGLR